MSDPRSASAVPGASATPDAAASLEGTDPAPPADALPPDALLTDALPADALPADALPADAQAAGTGIERAAVGRWFTDHIDGVTLPLDFTLIAGGRSNLTFGVVDAAGRRYVLRRPPTSHLLPTAHDMGREHRIISALGPAGVPVPDALGYCSDPSVTGAPFYVMDFVDGHILRSEADLEGVFDAAARRRLSENLVDTLARIHTLDPDEVGLGDLARREGYIARQLKRWYAQYNSSREQGGPEVGDVDAVHDHLVTRIPEQGRAGIVHGDYRLDNTIVGADAGVVAVLDWELCTLGDTMADVGQLLVYWTDPGEASALAHSATTAGGFATRQELADRYAEVSGRSMDQLDFYLAFAYWKLACILEGVFTRYLAGAMGTDGFDFRGYPPMIVQLAAQARTAAERLG